MFWGLVLEPGKRYSQKVGKAFHISMATLEITNSTENDLVSVMLEYQDGKEYLLCTLNKVKCYQCPLDLNFKEGENIGFYSAVGQSKPQSKVHLTGYMLEELDSDMLSEEEEDDEEMVSENIGKKRKESLDMKAGGKKIKLTEAFDEIEEEEDEDDSDFEGTGDDDEITEEAEDEEEDDDEEDDDDEEEEEDSDELETPKAKTEKPKQVKTPNEKKAGKGPGNKKEAGKTPIKEQNGQTPASHKKNKKQGETPKQGTPQKSFNKGGVDIVDSVPGNGALAKPGSKIVVYYTGRLKHNNKQFDSTTSGAGFKFTLGRGEVIKGWDIGVVGMHVGGKRTITIPPHLAYGKKGQPPVIPSNSTLVFDIELKNVF